MKKDGLSKETIQDVLDRIELNVHIVNSLSGDNIQINIRDVHFYGSREKLLSQLARLSAHFNSLVQNNG